MRNQRIGRVEITTKYTDITLSEIYMTNGVIVWDNSTGLLTQNWLSSLVTGVQIKTYGKLSEIKGGSISINSWTLNNTLLANSISLTGAIIKIIESINNVDYTLFTGEIIGLPTLQKEKMTVIRFDSLQRNRNAIMTKQLPNSSDYYPVFFLSAGHLIQKLINTTADEVGFTVSSSGAQYAFSASQIAPFSLYNTMSISPSITVSFSDGKALEAEMNGLLEQGYTFRFTGNGNTLNFTEYTFSYDNINSWLVGIQIVFQDGNLDPENGGVASASTGILTAVKNISYADLQSTISDDIFTFENGKYVSIPDYIDEITISDSGTSVNVTSDGEGFTRIAPDSIELVTPSNKPSWLIPTNTPNYEDKGWWKGAGTIIDITESGASIDTIIDADVDFYYGSRFNSNNVHEANLIFRLDHPAIKELPSNLWFTGKVDIGDFFALNVTDVLKVEVWLDWKYGHTTTPSTPNPSDVPTNWLPDGTRNIINTPFPTLSGVEQSVEGAKLFRYNSGWDSVSDNDPEDALNGFSLDLIPLITDAKNYSLSNGFALYVALRVEVGAPFNIDITTQSYNFSTIKSQSFSEGELYCTSFSSRSQTMRDAYIEALQLQNYKANNIEPPAEGWGLAVPTGVTWSELYDDSSIDSLIDAAIYYQYGKVDTATLKRDILKQSGCIGGVGRDGIERVFDLSSLIYNADGVIIELEDNYSNKTNPKPEDVLPEITPRNPVDITPKINVAYLSNVATEKQEKTISIINPTDWNADSVVADELTGTEKEELWDLANALYRGWGSVNYLSDSTGKTFLFADKVGAIEFIKRTYAIQGAFINSLSLPEAYERFIVTSKVYKPTILSNNIDFGSKVRIRRIDNSLLSACVVNIVDKGDYYQVTSEAVGNSLIDGAPVYIIEDEGNTDTITEDEANTDTITEGVY